MKYLLAIDQGTSSSRVIAFNLAGLKVLSSQYSVTLSYPYPDFVELSPDEILATTRRALVEVVEQLGVESIIACGVTNQRETTLIWDKETGQCLGPAIVWQDRRTQAYCQSLSAHSTLIQEKTGLLPDAYFSASKIKWILDNVPGARDRANQNALAFGTVDCFLLWHLTGGLVHQTDITNASRTLLFNIHEACWDETLLALFDIPKSILPSVTASDAYFGDIVGFSKPIPITGMIGDQQAALVGQACFQPGMIKATYGTGGFLVMNTGSHAILSKHGLLTTIAYKLQSQTHYALEGSIYHAGSIVKWLRDSLKLITEVDTTASLAASLENNGGVYLVPSFTGLGAPHWLAANGAILSGLTLHTTSAHIVRAALEAVCYQTKDILTIMIEESQHPIDTLRVDGGMTKNDWLLAYLQALCQVSLENPCEVEITAKGAAMVAGLGIGVYKSIETLAALWQPALKLTRSYSFTSITRDYHAWKEALQRLISQR